MKRFPAPLLLIPLFLLTGLYFFLSYSNGGVCFKSPICTTDVKTLCSPADKGIWQGPSSCSCGLDASTLESRGWTECEVPENYTGKIQTRSPLVELSSIQISKTLPLLIVPFISLSIGIGAIVSLWKRQERY